jgi:two-component system alkaline phosphatase synthesis response regulator PhoP
VAGLRKILLVEDNIELRNLYEIFLKQHGYHVSIAADGEEGLTVAKDYRPDLVFLDIMMPKKSGLEVLKTLRHNPDYHCANAKIIILTNLGDSAKVDAEVRRDMDGYVIKAEIELSDLLEIIKSFEG